MTEAPDDDPTRPHGPRPCPICRKPAVDKYRPFCSTRCANVDLSRWLGGVYAIPVENEDEEDEPPLGRPRES